MRNFGAQGCAAASGRQPKMRRKVHELTQISYLKNWENHFLAASRASGGAALGANIGLLLLLLLLLPSFTQSLPFSLL